MTPDDYQRMNDILIVQAGEMEIALQQKDERIRDLEARAAYWKRMTKYYWKGQKMAIDQTRPWFDRTNAAEAEIEHLKAEIEIYKASRITTTTVSGSSNTNPKQRTVLHRDR